MTTISLITGANKGIGFETARLPGTRGMTVLAGARDEARGREAERALRAGGADARYVPPDVTDEGVLPVFAARRRRSHPGQQGESSRFPYRLRAKNSRTPRSRSMPPTPVTAPPI